MESYTTGLIDIVACGSGVMTCRFEKPDGYTFVPGQFLMLGVESTNGPERKPLSIASAPQDPWLEVTTRLSGSTFKTALAALVSGGVATVSPAAGRLVVPPGVARRIFLAGGVGITPAHSILRHAMLAGLPLNDVLFFGNRDAECIPYSEEFAAMAGRGLRTVNVLQYPPDGWTGESGFITADLVRSLAEPAPGVVWICSGPPTMVEAMSRLLDELQVPEPARLIERFSGYA